MSIFNKLSILDNLKIKKRKMEKSVLPGIFVIMLIGLVFCGLYYTDSSITGHISAPFIEEVVDFYAISNQEVFFGLKDTSSIDLSSLKITGRIIGEGDVSIYVQDGIGNKLLVFSNKLQESFGLLDVTGLVVGGFCGSDEDCEEGEHCEDGLCMMDIECYFDEDCEEGEHCEDGLCVMVNGCLDDLDCSGLEVCKDGNCAKVSCLDDLDCFSGESCFKNECILVDCFNDTSCEEDYFCSEGFCVLKDVILKLVQPVDGIFVESSFFVIARYEINKGSGYNLKLFVDGKEYDSYEVDKQFGIVDFIVDSRDLENGDHTLYFSLNDVVSKEVRFIVNNGDEGVLEDVVEEKMGVEKKELVFVPSVEEKPKIKRSDIKGEKVYKFNDECEDTCFITRKLSGESYRLVIEVEEGTLLKIDQISYY